MQQFAKRYRIAFISLLCIAVTVLCAAAASSPEPFFAGSVSEYYEELVQMGFPQDYAEPLTELHLLHPEWSFIPLNITKINPAYTWDYVIEQETAGPKENLVYNYDEYAAYRHPTNNELYDSGYYQASVETVEYFMDPRNFLNENDIFQFFDLSAGFDAPQSAVESVLSNTFMENAFLENGKTYAENFCEIGEALQINPIFLAAKIRQEQGLDGASPLLSGKAGTLLNDYYQNQTQTNPRGRQILPPVSGYSAEELSALDGYYNVFNINASGTGLFQIYYNALVRASQGTPELADIFGGSAAWDARWKAMYGGAYVLKKSYVDRYQPTPYLQKFNVDGRAADRNFWGQYMQLIWGSLNEAHSVYASFSAIDALDLPLNFLIPVYAEMPQTVSPDPALGACASLAKAPARYSYSAAFTSPMNSYTENAPVYETFDAERGSVFSYAGSVRHSYGVTGIEYAIDGGDWICCNGKDRFEIDIPIEESDDTAHILIVRGEAAFDNENELKRDNRNFLISVVRVNPVADK